MRKTNAEYNREYHAKNRTAILARNREYRYDPVNAKRMNEIQRKRKIIMSDEFMLWKQNVGCTQCGYNAHGAALDFNHLDPSQKVCQITAQNWKTAKGEEERMKCELLCANCHRIETFKQRRPL